MSLLTTAQVRRLVRTELDEAELQELIDQEEAEVVRRYGVLGDGVSSVTETYEGMSASGLLLRRPFVSVSAVTTTPYGGGAPSTVETTAYQALGSEGRLLHLGGGWGSGIVTVLYIPIDDRARRRQVLVELLRLTLEQTAMQSESVAGEYSYSAPASWEAARARLYRRLGFWNV